VAEIEKAGLKAAALQLNTGDIKSFDAFFGQLKTTLNDTFGTKHFDFLINNAGVGYHAPIAETTEEKFDMLVNIHFKGVYFLTQKALPIINDGGRIINISSGAGRNGIKQMAAYCASKFGVIGFTESLALEVRGHTQALHDRLGVPAAREVDDELGEHVHLDVGDVGGRLLHVVHALLDRERRLLVRGLADHADDDPVEDRRGAADDVDVPERHRVVRAGIDRRDHNSNRVRRAEPYVREVRTERPWISGVSFAPVS